MDNTYISNNTDIDNENNIKEISQTNNQIIVVTIFNDFLIGYSCN